MEAETDVAAEIAEADDTVGPVRTVEPLEDGGNLVVADLGIGPEATVDVVDATAIVVTPEGQFEFDLPGTDAEALIRNGVLTVEVPR